MFNKSKKLDFLVCGAQKSGTSALDRYLRAHDEICMPDGIKELHFFDDDQFFEAKKISYSKYHKHFKRQSSHKIAGEVTPSYMFVGEAVKRIWEYNSAIRLVVILRSPIERAYSQWNMRKRSGREALSFDECIKREMSCAKEGMYYRKARATLISRGFYCEQIRRLLYFFPRSSLHIIRNEDLRNSPNDTMKEIYEFLGVSPSVFSRSQQLEASSSLYPSMRKRFRNYMGCETQFSKVTCQGSNCS
jgi:hypothetical protein